MPISPKDKDRRYAKRNEVWNNAVECKKNWEKIKKTEMKEEYLQMIEMLVKETGFFSVWMSVFKDDVEIKEMLIHTFKGTRKEYCIDTVESGKKESLS